MVWIVRSAAALALFAALITPQQPARAQGGQGQFGGGNAGRLAEAREGDPVSFQHILTPGDSGEWPITARAGETIIVFVTSTTFDPAAQVVDAAGKVLAENDDVRPGVQDSLILYRFATAGEYKILVKGFKSASGGQYTLSLRRFVATDLKKAERNAATLGRTRTHWHRFSADTGDTLVVAVQSATFLPDTEIYAPSGERIEPVARASGSGHFANSVFRAAAKGDYYLRVASNRETGGYVATVATARVSPLTVGVANPVRHLDSGGLDLWTFQATSGAVLAVHAAGSGPSPEISMRYLPSGDKADSQIDSAGGEDALTVLPVGPKRPGDLIVIVKRTGSYQIEVGQEQGLQLDYTLSTAPATRAWPAGADPAGRLPIGGSDYWAIDGRAGQVLKIEGQAEPFDVALELFNPHGDRVESNDDGGGGHNALITTLLKDTGRYLLRVHAFGDGGSGAYKLLRRPDPVRPVKIGGRIEASVGAGTSDVWSFEGKAGQTVILSVRSREFDTRALVYGPDAIEIANDDTGHDGTDSLISVRLPLTGIYTIWISSRSAGGKYILRLVDAE